MGEQNCPKKLPGRPIAAGSGRESTLFPVHSVSGDRFRRGLFVPAPQRAGSRSEGRFRTAERKYFAEDFLFLEKRIRMRNKFIGRTKIFSKKVVQKGQKWLHVVKKCCILYP